MRVDAQDNIWAVDEGTDMLVKFSPEGKVLMAIGRREDPLASLAQHAGRRRVPRPQREVPLRPRRPTSRCDQQGNIFVSDGYFDARVVKYDKNGRFVKAVGTRGNGNLQFNTPHSIATDFQGNVYVGDRGNARVQVLDNDLNWKANYTNVGNPWAVCVSGGPGRRIPASSISTSRTRGPTARRPRRPSSPARSTRWSSTAPSSASSARPARRSGSSRRSTRWTAAIPNVIYTAEINNWRSQKILLKPQAVTTTSAN